MLMIGGMTFMDLGVHIENCSTTGIMNAIGKAQMLSLMITTKEEV